MIQKFIVEIESEDDEYPEIEHWLNKLKGVTSVRLCMEVHQRPIRQLRGWADYFTKAASELEAIDEQLGSKTRE